MCENNQNECYSFHYFMFPFRFDKILKPFNNKYKYYEEYDFDKRVKDQIYNLKEALVKNGWKYYPFKINNRLDYNELAYFYDFAKESIFNMQEFNEGKTSYYFEKKLLDESFYIINTSSKSYKLKLESITLRVFDTGIAILAYEVVNFDFPALDDILKINEFGRRVYPPFIGKNGIIETKEKMLATSIEVLDKKDDFNTFNEYQKLTTIPLPKFIIEILGKDSFTTHFNEKNKFFIQPIGDDRMFVVCWYGNDELSNCLKSIDFYKDDNYSNNQCIDNWYRFIFIDAGDITIKNSYMKKGILLKSTYLRWQEYGTLFGVSRYSFVSLTSSYKELKKYNADFLVEHMNTLYFQLITLLLAQRASIIRFSDEIAAVASSSSQNLASKVSTLYKNYLIFRSKLFFKEITAQDQGIELYKQTQKVMEIEEHINEIDNEIKSLNEYAKLEIEKKENNEMKKLTKLGTIFLPGTFLAGIFGMNVFKEGWINNLGGLILAFLIIGWVTWWFVKKNNIDIIEFIKTGNLENNIPNKEA